MLHTLKKIAFIGAGNMAQAIINGLIKADIKPDTIFASDRSESARLNISSRFEVLTGSNRDACEDADVIVLAVKPQVLKSVCEDLRPSVKPGTLLISIAAGINCTSLRTWLGDHAIVRAMPNTPAAVGIGASGLYANELTSSAQKDAALKILQAVGDVIYVDSESLIDAVTAVSGSGPAYFFLFIEAMSDAGQTLGLDRQTAEHLAIQTAFGAASLVKQSEYNVETLRANVTSPNGTTERAIQSFESNNLRGIVADAMDACAKRAKALSDELGAE